MRRGPHDTDAAGTTRFEPDRPSVDERRSAGAVQAAAQPPDQPLAANANLDKHTRMKPACHRTIRPATHWLDLRSRRGVASRVVAGLAALATAVLLSESLSAQVRYINREYHIKAAYLYNFGRYIRWPKDWTPPQADGRVFRIVVVGESPVADILEQIARIRTIDGRRLEVSLAKKPSEIQLGHILFISRSAPQRLVRAAEKLAAGHPVLLVGETTGFAERTGMINMYVEENRVRFEINVARARQAGLDVSAKLLQVGRVVVASNELGGLDQVPPSRSPPGDY